jgi:hypothetical protein
MSRLALSIMIAAGSLAGVGCKSTSRNDMIDASPVPDRPSLAVPTGGGPMSVAGALNVLASARCQREQLCGRVGSGKTYRDIDTCERTALQAHANDVSLFQCAGSIDGKRLDVCASKLRGLPCDHDEVAASETCGAGKLCLKE